MNDLCPVAVSQDSANLEDQPKTAGESHLLLLKQKKYCDVTFTFPNLPDRIAAHQIYLKARSPVFEQIFRMRKSGNVQVDEIEISGSTPEMFQQFLEFIYTDKFEVDIAGALELLQLAQKYKVQPFTDKCEELLRTEIKAEESVKVFEAARRYSHQELMHRAGEIMVKSFRPSSLGELDALMSAEEGTVIYLLERDDLSVQEVGLFEFILDWGRKQVGTSAGEQLLKLKDKLKNVISKIRYTNMTQLEFTTVVVPTGFLSAEETLSVYSYICGDKVTRRGLNIDFNTTHRKVENRESYVCFYARQGQPNVSRSAAVSKQLISFKVERTEDVTGRWSDYLLKKAVITEIRLQMPILYSFYKGGTILRFYISIREHSSPTHDTDFTTRFQEVLLNPKSDVANISVDPPVELIPGKTFSIIVEDLSTSDLTFRNDGKPYHGVCIASTNLQKNVELEEAPLALNEIQRSTEYYSQEYTTAAEIALIGGIITRLV